MCKPRLPFKHDRGLRRDTAKLRIWGSGVRISSGAPTKSGTYRIAVCPENWPGQTRGRSENDLVAATLVRVFAWAAPREGAGTTSTRASGCGCEAVQASRKRRGSATVLRRRVDAAAPGSPPVMPRSAECSRTNWPSRRRASCRHRWRGCCRRYTGKERGARRVGSRSKIRSAGSTCGYLIEGTIRGIRRRVRGRDRRSSVARRDGTGGAEHGVDHRGLTSWKGAFARGLDHRGYGRNGRHAR